MNHYGVKRKKSKENVIIHPVGLKEESYKEIIRGVVPLKKKG